jgi:hypothetical protein
MYYSNSEDEQVQSGQGQEVMKLEVFHGMLSKSPLRSRMIIHYIGSDRHVLLLRSINNIRVGDLMEELQNITTVPVQTQRLYYRGQALQSMKEHSLREVGLDNNSQVRLIGEPTRSRYVGLMTGN